MVKDKTTKVVPQELKDSFWFKKGQEEGRARTPIKKTIVFKLRFGCRQQDEFLAGYDNPDA